MNDPRPSREGLPTRREFLATGAVAVAATGFPALAMAATSTHSRATTDSESNQGGRTMSTTAIKNGNMITTKDGVEIFFKDWGPRAAQPLVFHHGWPLTSDDWDTQLLYFLDKGYRVIAHDRRGHGRSSQVSDGHDMDHYAADVAAVVEHLDLRNAVHIGHSTGGGEATHYVAQHGERQGRVAKLVLIGAVPPIMVKTAANPGGLPLEVFDGFRAALAANRAQFYRDVASGPFYGFNRPGAKVSEAVIENWWRQGMSGGAKAHYDGIKAFSETDFTEDLKSIDAPTLVMHGDDDQVVPIAASALLSAKLLKKGTLKVYEKFPHGMCTIHADVINPDLLAFIKS
jgi:non-heme chloroperoxidase